jgi:myo-inositol 2-dehydrogenase/D-chiro-inositol 1-dehydrogenase
MNARYGYDIRTELVGAEGMLSMNTVASTKVACQTGEIATYPSDWTKRFADAYRLQLQAWVNGYEQERFSGASAWDGYVATKVAEAGCEALNTDTWVQVAIPDRPAIFNT